MTPDRNIRRHTLRSVQSSPGRSFLSMLFSKHATSISWDPRQTGHLLAVPGQRCCHNVDQNWSKEYEQYELCLHLTVALFCLFVIWKKSSHCTALFSLYLWWWYEVFKKTFTFDFHEKRTITIPWKIDHFVSPELACRTSTLLCYISW